MNRVDRLVALILYLQSQPLATADEMAIHFGRSLRTIYRDLAALGEAGVPVVAQAGIGYALARGYHLPPVSFTPEEASALVTGGLLVERSAGDATSRQMRSALMKVRAVLPKELLVQIQRLSKAMLYTAAPRPRPEAADLMLLQQALSKQQVLRMTYQGWAAEVASERTVEPLGLLHYLERWHLIAWCRDRQAVRDFRTDRMSRVRPLKEHFEPRNFSIQEYLHSMPRPDLRAEVCFAPKVVDRAYREWWLGISAVRASEAGPVLALAAVDWDSLVGWLLSFGTDVQVLKPASLRQSLAAAAKAAAAHHGKKPRAC